MGFISDITGITGARAAGQARQDASRREDQNIATIGASYDVARGAAQGARDEWNALAQYGADNMAGNQLYRDAIGLNGPEGIARARSSFSAAPGYGYEVDQATDAAMRRANAMGMLPSGNTMQAVRGAAQDQANRGWNAWLDRLMGTGQAGVQAAATAAGGRAAGWNSLSTLARDAGRDAIGVTNQAGQQIQGLMGQEAQARAAGSTNMLNAGMGLASLALSAAGGMPGGFNIGGLGKMLTGGGGGGGGYTASYGAGVGNPGGTGGWY